MLIYKSVELELNKDNIYKIFLYHGLFLTV